VDRFRRVLQGIFTTWRWAMAVGLILCMCIWRCWSARRLDSNDGLDDADIFVMAQKCEIFRTATPVFLSIAERYHMVVFRIGAWGSVAIGSPFTTAYAARKRAPRIWESIRFCVVNLLILTLVGGTMTVSWLRGKRCQDGGNLGQGRL